MKNLLKSICDSARQRGATFADARVVDGHSTSIMRQDGRVDRVSQGATRGLGIRVLKDRAWGFASVADFDAGSAMEALGVAVSMAEVSAARSEEAMVSDIQAVEDKVEASVQIDPRQVSIERKMAALQGYEQAATQVIGDKLANSILSYYDAVENEIVCNTGGTCVEQETIRTYMGSNFTVRDGSVLQAGSKRVGKPIGFELIEQTSAEEFSVRAANLAISLLRASPPPAGKFPVVFHPSVTGILTHEAIGHNAEADAVLNGTSIVAGKVGERIASELVTIVDDSTVPNAWGSFKYDSEGTPGARRVMIENGILKGYMHSLQTAAKMGVAPNGSARADDYYNRPIIRMSNTFIEPGRSSFEDLFRGIDTGIYLKGAEYGHVFCERGQFMCHAAEAYLIRNGEVTEHLRDVSIAGMTLETLMNIDMVAGDFEMKMPGRCGKDGQGMSVDNGGPHIRIKELVVGGRR